MSRRHASRPRGNSKAAPLPLSPEFAVHLAPQDKTSLLVASDGQFAIAPGPLAEAKRPQGAGVKFDGKTGLVFGKAFEFDPAQLFTFTVWVQVPAKGGGGPILSSMDKDEGFQLSIDDFKPTIWIKHGTSLKVTGKAKLTPGAWHHLVFSGDGRKAAAGGRIHGDGKRAGTQTIEDRLGDAPAFARRKPLHLAEVAGGAKFTGSLDALAFFRGQFTDEQILLAGGDLVARLLARPERSNRDAILVDHYLRTADARHAQLLNTFSQAMDAERSLKAGMTSVMVMLTNEAETAAIHLPVTSSRRGIGLTNSGSSEPRSRSPAVESVAICMPPTKAANTRNIGIILKI